MKITVFNALNLQSKKDGDLGIEVEVQGHDLPRLDNANWFTTTDGSLRGDYEGKEYVLKEPQSLHDAGSSLDRLRASFKRKGSTIVSTGYAGVHVHVNVQDLTIKELFTFITCYYLLEETLIDFCGETRKGNHFCLRGKDAEGVIMKLRVAAQSGNLDVLNTDRLRYGAMNPTSLFNFGSLEFRAMRSLDRHMDTASIYNWCKILLELRDNSLKFSDPLDALRATKGGGLDFLHTILPETHTYLSTEDLSGQVKRGRRLVQPFVHLSDWTKYIDKNINPFSLGGYYAS